MKCDFVELEGEVYFDMQWERLGKEMEVAS